MLVPASLFRNDQNLKKTENSDVKGCAGKKELNWTKLDKKHQDWTGKNQDIRNFRYK